MPGRKILGRNKTEIRNKRNNFFTNPNLGRNWSDLHLKDIIIIVFHDIVPGLEESVRKVTKFQRETKSKFNYEEFVKDWDQGGYGIGIIFV